MPDRVDRAFGGGIDGGDTNIHSIQPSIRTRREIPLRGAGGGSCERLGVTHHTTLRTTYRNLKPACNWILYKIYRAIIHNETGGRLGWIRKLIA